MKKQSESKSTIDSSGRTVVQVVLPYAMHGAEGLYLNVAGEVVISLKEQPTELTRSYLLMDVEQEEPKRKLMLTPDNLGIIHRTVVAVRTKGYLAIDPPKGDSLENYERIMLEKCEIAISDIFDWYTYCSRNFALPKISLQDIVSYEVWHEMPNDSVQHNYVMRTLRTAKLRFMPELKTEGDKELQERMMLIQKLPTSYRLAITLFTEAMRALYIGNTRLACVQAASSVEIALGYYIETKAKNYTDDHGQKRLSSKAYDDVKKDTITLSSMLKLFFPLLLPSNVKFPREIIAACDRIRKNRNDAIHSGVEPKKADIEKDILMVESLINFLNELEPPSI
jgi:hypothetical protein